MEMYLMTMEIISQSDDGHMQIDLCGLRNQTSITYHFLTRKIIYSDNNVLSQFIQQNEKQFRKILHAKKDSILKPGFKLKFALCNKKDVDAFNNINNIIALDKRGNSSHSYIVKQAKKNLPEIFTDGSFLKTHDSGGYVVLIKSVDGEYHLHTLSTNEKSSSLIELLAAIKGLEILKDKKQLRIVTDSQYVRKGITEWIFYWKLNGWLTANGKSVRNIDYWKRFDELTDNKYIEFQWVKSHSGHFENTICDLYAKETASGIYS